MKMQLTEEEARETLQAHNLRATAPRLHVMIALSKVSTPITYTDLLNLMGEIPWHPATLFRNLVKLSEVGICVTIRQADGMSRYALVQNAASNTHAHPHFVCENCGVVACLPISISVDAPKEWEKAVHKATIQLSGNCPTCLETDSTTERICDEG